MAIRTQIKRIPKRRDKQAERLSGSVIASAVGGGGSSGGGSINLTGYATKTYVNDSVNTILGSATVLNDLGKIELSLGGLTDFYKRVPFKANDETITGNWTFTNTGITALSNVDYSSVNTNNVLAWDGKKWTSNGNFTRKNNDEVISGQWEFEEELIVSGIGLNSVSMFTGNTSSFGALSNAVTAYYNRNSLSESSFVWSDNYNNSLAEIDSNGHLYTKGSAFIGGAVTDYDGFVSGFAGSGWNIDDLGNATFESVTVRGAMSTYTLQARQIDAVGGSLWITDRLEITGATWDGARWTLHFDPAVTCTFESGDYLRGSIGWGATQKTVDVFASQINQTVGTVVCAVNAQGDTPVAGMVFVRYDSYTNADRRGSIYMSANDSNAPFIDVVLGNGNKNLTTKLRVGKLDGITNIAMGLDGTQTNYYGLYANGGVHISGEIYSDKGVIGGNTINSDGIISSSQHVHFSNTYNRIAVTKDATTNPSSGARVQMYYSGDTSWGLWGSIDGTNPIFQLGSTNQVAGWAISSNSLSKSYLNLNSGSNWMGVNYNTSNYSRLYYTSSSDYGFKAVKGGSVLAQFGTTNRIGEWYFDGQNIYNEAGETHIYLQNSIVNSGTKGLGLSMQNTVAGTYADLSYIQIGQLFPRVSSTSLFTWGSFNDTHAYGIQVLKDTGEQGYQKVLFRAGDDNGVIAGWLFDEQRFYSDGGAQFSVTGNTIVMKGSTLDLKCRINNTATDGNFVWSTNTATSNLYNVVIGHGTSTGNHNSVVVGRSSYSSGNCGIALGYNSVVTGNYSTALGYNSSVTASSEIRLGNSGTTVKLGNGTTVTSDLRDKADIQENDLGLDFINSVNTFKWKDNNRDKYYKTEVDKTGTELIVYDKNKLPILDEKSHQEATKKGERWHRGVVAQNLLESFDSIEFAAVKDTTVNNSHKHVEEMTVNYLEFIAPMIKAIQELSGKVNKLENM